MSLKKTLHSKCWKVIPKKCKQCAKATYTIENNEAFYQCSLFGVFKRNCEINAFKEQVLPSSEDIIRGKK